MISSAEVVELLKIANGFDNRKPSEKMRDAWLEAAERSRWTFAEAADAIREHYSDRTEFIMPGHITALILRERHQARPPGAPSARPLREVLDDRNPDEAISDEATRLAFLADIRRSLAGKTLDLDDPEGVDTRSSDPTDDGDACLSVQCPWCHAAIGTRCTTRGRPMRRRSCHPARKAAKLAALLRAQ